MQSSGANNLIEQQRHFVFDDVECRKPEIKVEDKAQVLAAIMLALCLKMPDSQFHCILREHKLISESLLELQHLDCIGGMALITQ